MGIITNHLKDTADSRFDTPAGCGLNVRANPRRPFPSSTRSENHPPSPNSSCAFVARRGGAAG